MLGIRDWPCILEHPFWYLYVLDFICAEEAGLQNHSEVQVVPVSEAGDWDFAMIFRRGHQRWQGTGKFYDKSWEIRQHHSMAYWSCEYHYHYLSLENGFDPPFKFWDQVHDGCGSGIRLN